ncbi:MAG TPA: hypothetical protein VGL38_01490 [bacterium]|jgi:hypothetical protein
MIKALYAGFALLCACVILGLVAPQPWLWGTHFLAYYPWPVQVTLPFVAVALLLTGFSRVRWRGLLPDLPPALAFSPLQWDVLTALGCGVVFLLFSSATALLGDGQLWLNEIQAGTSDYLRNRAPLTLFLLHTLYGLLNPLTGISAERLFALTSVIAGTAAVLGWLVLARHLRIDRLTCLLFGFAWGGIALFFGYIETYVLMVAIITWMLVVMVISLRKAEPTLFVPVLGLLAVGFNLAAVVFLPAVMAYTWRMFSARHLRLRWVLLFGYGLIVPALGAYFALGWHKGTDVLLPLTPTTEAFGDAVLTGSHLAGLINGLLLAAGVFLVLLAGYVIAEKRHGMVWDDEKLLLLLALVFPLAACVMHNPQLGMARDWDICAALLAGAPIMSLVIWDSTHPFADSPGRIRALLTVWILLMIVPWVGVQASETRSVARFKDLLKADPARSESGWDYLSSYYFHHNRMDEWGQCNFEAMRYSNNPRYHANAALYFGMRKDWPNARYQAGLARASVMADSVVTTWESSVTDPAALISLGNSYLEQAYVSDARQAFEVAAALQPDSPWPRVASVDLFLKLRSFEEAQRVIETLACRSPAALEEMRRYYTARTTESHDQQLTAWLALCLIAESTGDQATAEQNAQRALALSHDEQTAHFLSQLHPPQPQALP